MSGDEPNFEQPPIDPNVRVNHDGNDGGWFKGLTETDASVDEPDEPETPDPIVPQPGRPLIESYLTWMVENKGSDLHIYEGEVPRVRVHGALRPIPGAKVIDQDTVVEMIADLLTAKQSKEFAETRDIDAAYEMRTDQGAAVNSRFRTNAFVALDRYGLVMRVIPTKIRTLDELGVLPQIKTLSKLPRGLVLITGPTGSGKSTTLAALVDLMNTTRDDSIFTFEDPVEFTHHSKRCMIRHREVGTDTESFYSGLKAVRREDPDIILIGEMRDTETIRAAIEAADTGHLVLATLHTSSAYETVGRIINTFPEEEQNQIRVTLASILKAVVCQTLIPSPHSEMGRVVATEIMMVTPGIANNIRENDLPAIRNALSDTSSGSISLDAHLAQLINEGKISKREAMKKASSEENLTRQLGGTGKA
ncbi:type IV pilus twitching motility protein PilT [Aeromicrobium sp. 179-A 4D2 NHS]|uniref:type IV pilus twitching motility protein PilT n=1 Tax=Aeromicrobium sp. 179-A 4D2 NHS TaxID=3142375 RepID=UPI0039A2E95C